MHQICPTASHGLCFHPLNALPALTPLYSTLILYALCILTAMYTQWASPMGVALLYTIWKVDWSGMQDPRTGLDSSQWPTLLREPYKLSATCKAYAQVWPPLDDHLNSAPAKWDISKFLAGAFLVLQCGVVGQVCALFWG